MAQIALLPPHLADLIAAGEMVERPASIVKELVENAIDAGATQITVEIKHGGVTLVRVADNGCGIPPDQVATAFLRHATSKISREEDLEGIATLGFRGEALAAITAVSQVEVLTKTAEHPVGFGLTIEGGEILEQGEAGCPKGTTIIVRNVFFNTPVRQRFLKKDVVEGAASSGVVERAAMSHPEVAFRFIRDGKTIFTTDGDGSLRSVVYSVLGREVTKSLVPLNSQGQMAQLEGFVSDPEFCRGSRAQQFFFVNGRHIHSPLLTAALERAYQNMEMKGRFPAGVIQLTMSPAAVDVNVHPTKTEVRFVSDKKAFDDVYYAVLSALGAQDKFAIDPQEMTGPAPTLLVFREPPSSTVEPPTSTPSPLTPPTVEPPTVEPSPLTPSTVEPPPLTPSTVEPPTVEPPTSTPPTVEPPPLTPPPLEEETPPLPWRMIGEVFSTYIMVEQGTRLILIDKHAAHERMEFDKLKEENYRPMPQHLLTPLVVELGEENSVALLESATLLGEFAFEIEDFGGRTLVVRAIPSDLAPDQAEGVLGDLAQSLRTLGRADPAGQRDALLRSMACKAAIKGGQRNDPLELERVAHAVLSGQVRYCPHGRPVSQELTKADLEKRFKRT